MLQLATRDELERLHTTLIQAIEEYGNHLSSVSWGWPGGQGVGIQPSTYLFTLKQGVLLLCHNDLDNRWWLAVALLDSYPTGQVSISFEFNIPKDPGTNLETAFISENGLIKAIHKGRFTVGRGTLSRETFFNYYRENPDYWPVMEDEGSQYLVLFTFDLNNFCYQQFYAFLSTLADFGEYITWYKDEYRGR